MRLYVPHPEKESDCSFDSGYDALSRKELGESLTNLVCRLEGPHVLVIDGDWGIGKSTFIKMWRKYLDENGVPSAYFDAFGADFHQAAFLALTKAVVESTREIPGVERSEQAKNFQEKSAKIFKLLGRVGLNASVRFVTLNALKGDDLSDLGDDVRNIIQETSEDAADEIIKEIFYEPNKEKHALEEFKSSFFQLSK